MFTWNYFIRTSRGSNYLDLIFCSRAYTHIHATYMAQAHICTHTCIKTLKRTNKHLCTSTHMHEYLHNLYWHPCADIYTYAYNYVTYVHQTHTHVGDSLNWYNFVIYSIYNILYYYSCNVLGYISAMDYNYKNMAVFT